MYEGLDKTAGEALRFGSPAGQTSGPQPLVFSALPSGSQEEQTWILPALGDLSVLGCRKYEEGLLPHSAEFSAQWGWECCLLESP